MEGFKKDFNRHYIKEVLIVKERIRTRTNGFKQDKFKFRKEIYRN